MPDFLKTVLNDGPAIDPWEVAIRLLIAFAFGVGIATLYRRTHAAAHIAPSFPTTLVLLAILIAMVTQVIGDNVARAFSLVGALSIVRFRTVVRDTQDTAYVIFSVVVGMAVGADNVAVAIIGLVVVSVAAFLLRDRVGHATAGAPPTVITVRAAISRDLEELAAETIDAHMIRRRLLSIRTAKHETALEASYEGTLRSEESASVLVKALLRVEGVQSVELVREPPHHGE